MTLGYFEELPYIFHKINFPSPKIHREIHRGSRRRLRIDIATRLKLSSSDSPISREKCRNRGPLAQEKPVARRRAKLQPSFPYHLRARWGRRSRRWRGGAENRRRKRYVGCRGRGNEGEASGTLEGADAQPVRALLCRAKGCGSEIRMSEGTFAPLLRAVLSSPLFILSVVSCTAGCARHRRLSHADIASS